MTVQVSAIRSLNRVFINRSYTFLWAGQTVSSLGDSIYSLTLVVWVAAVMARQPDGQSAPWAPIAVSGVLVSTALPFLLFGSIAGVFADHWDKKRTMLWADLLRTLLVSLSILISGSSFLPWKPTLAVQLGAIYTTVFLISSCSQFFTPARAAMIGEIVEKKQLARASGLAQVSLSMASILGPHCVMRNLTREEASRALSSPPNSVQVQCDFSQGNALISATSLLPLFQSSNASAKNKEMKPLQSQPSLLFSQKRCFHPIARSQFLHDSREVIAHRPFG
jgi:Transmembrane secretion effector